MKKNIIALLLVFSLLWAFSACAKTVSESSGAQAGESSRVEQGSSGQISGSGSQAADKSIAAKESLPPEDDMKETNIPSSEDRLIETDYGSYTLPAGWYEYDVISTAKKAFYVKDGVDLDKVSSNISIELGKNRYSADEHLEFREAIMAQLIRQAAAFEAGLDGSGSFTEAGDVLYTFVIEDEATKTTQYYIIGEKQYVLIHVTDFYDEETADVNDVAFVMANSFKWADKDE